MCALQDCPSDQTCHTVSYVFELPIRGCWQDGKLKVTAPCLASSHGLFTLTFLPLRFMLTHHQLAIRWIPSAIPAIDWFHHTRGAHACDFCSSWETGSLPTATLGYEATLSYVTCTSYTVDFSGCFCRCLYRACSTYGCRFVLSAWPTHWLMAL